MASGVGSRVTRVQVAQAAGVSTAVVSYVLNDGPRPVAPATRQRVLQAIEELGYRPNAAARAVKLGRTSTCGLLLPDVVQPFHSWVVRELDESLRTRGMSLLLANVHDSPAEEHAAVNDMLQRGVDLLVVLMSKLSDSAWLQAKVPVPVGMLDRPHALDGFLSIGPDFVGAGRVATSHLIEHGRRRIVPIFGSFVRGESNGRYEGYKQALQRAELEEQDPIFCAWSMEGGYQAGLEFVRRGARKIGDGADGRADAAFCFSDAIAVGFLRAMRESGVHVPDDVAVIGFDGIELVSFTAPLLTTVAQPVEDMVHFTVSSLLGDFEANTKDLHVFPVRLQKGHSCGC